MNPHTFAKWGLGWALKGSIVLILTPSELQGPLQIDPARNSTHWLDAETYMLHGPHEPPRRVEVRPPLCCARVCLCMYVHCHEDVELNVVLLGQAPGTWHGAAVWTLIRGRTASPASAFIQYVGLHVFMT